MPEDCDCAWCGGEIERDYPNKRGEMFCSPSHRSSSNRALKRLQQRESKVDAIKFKAVLHDGTILTGPIMGNSGMLCAGIHDTDMAKRVALDRIDQAKRLDSQGYRGPGIHEPEPGCVAIYPDFSAKGDGEPVAVPLLGTEFSIEGAKR